MRYHHPIIEFQPLAVPESKKIEWNDLIVFLGSCFSENIGGRLMRLYHPVVINPQGISFDPLTISRHLSFALKSEYQFRPVVRDGLYFSWDHHSSLYATTAEGLKNRLHSAVQATRKALEKATHVVVTLGTAYYYCLADNQLPVANCHKMPAQYFNKCLLSVADTAESIKKIQKIIKVINPNVTSIFTVSPVKHLRDGVVENTRSKSHLIAAVHQVVNSDDAYYFPAYEVVNEVLRNYEYYEEDMAHPNSRAIRAVYQLFCETWMADSSLKAHQEIDAFIKLLYHQPLHPESDTSKKWFTKIQSSKEKLTEQYALKLNEVDYNRWCELSAMFSSENHH